MNIIVKDFPHVASLEKSTKTFAKIILDIASKYDLEKILDLGTGSGYIAIALAKEGKIVDASDIVDEVLELAALNAAANHAQINFIKSDLFENIHNEYGLICFNPPCGRAGRFGMRIRGILKRLPGYETLTLGLGYFLYKEFRLELIARFLKECRSSLKKDGGLVALKLMNMELPSMVNLFRKNEFEVIEEFPVTRMTKAIVVRSLR